MKKLLSMSLVLLFSVVTLAACGGGDTASKNVLRLAKDVELASMDPNIATDGLSFESIAATIEGLYTLDATGKAIPAIATGYEVSADQLTYTFKLRDDAKWSNGDAVTANDFVFAWRRLVDPNTASEYGYIAGVGGVKNADAINAGELPTDQLGVKAVDDKTLVVELDRPIPFFLQLMAFPSFFPLNEKFVTEKGDQFAQSPENTLANGPFKLVEWTQGYGYKFEKNETYYDAKSVELDGIEVKIMKDPQTAALEFESGNIDFVRLSGEIVDLYKDREEFTLIHEGYLWYMAPNEESEFLSNENLRLALAHAYNKEQLTDTVLNDGSTPANFIVPVGLATGPDGLDFRETSPEFLQYDVAKAQEYFAKALTELNVDTVTIEMLFEDSEAIKKCAEYLQAELQKNLPGLKIELKSQPKKNRLELMRAGDYDLGLTRWGPDYADPTTYLDMFISGGSYNHPRYNNSEYDALMDRIDKGDLVGDVTARWQAMKDAEKMLLDDAGVLPMFQQGNTYLIRENVEGIENHSVGTPFIYKNVKLK